MKVFMSLLSAVAISTLVGCAGSSSSPNAEPGESYPPPKIVQEKKSAPAPAPSAAKPFTPAKPMKCAYDTDCVVQDSCSNGQCKLTGNICRFRSDCPPPRGTCVNKVCRFI